VYPTKPIGVYNSKHPAGPTSCLTIPFVCCQCTTYTSQAASLMHTARCDLFPPTVQCCTELTWQMDCLPTTGRVSCLRLGVGGGGGTSVQNAATTDHRRYLGISRATSRDECAYNRDRRRQLSRFICTRAVEVFGAPSRWCGVEVVQGWIRRQRLPPAGTL